mmetsp:Transcript_85667/g.239359  ORF Transcript_85667/g.239359 Transcript_85667/m.239359 type:complete len:317 (-) Transcript_85667:493-1443(-)
MLRSEVVAVDVVLARVLVGAAHQIEAMVPHDDGVPRARSVDLARLAIDALPHPKVFRHDRICSVHAVASGPYSTIVPLALMAVSTDRCGGRTRGASGSGVTVLSFGGALELGLCPQEDAVHVVEPPSVEASQNVHVAIVHNGLVESPGSRRDAGGVDLRPMAKREAVLMEVGEPVLRLVHAAKGKHRIAADHRRVAVARLRGGTTRRHLHPHVRRDVVLQKVLKRVVAIPTPEDEHRVAVHHGGMAETALGCRAPGRGDVAPAPLSELQFPEVVEAGVAIKTTIDQHGIPEEHDAVIGALLRHVAKGVHRPPVVRR